MNVRSLVSLYVSRLRDLGGAVPRSRELGKTFRRLADRGYTSWEVRRALRRPKPRSPKTSLAQIDVGPRLDLVGTPGFADGVWLTIFNVRADLGLSVTAVASAA